MLSNLLLYAKLAGAICTFIVKRLRLAVTARLHRLTYRTSPITNKNDSSSSSSSSSNPDDSLRNIVIIGASFAGYFAAHTLLATCLPRGYRVVIVEKNSHFQFTWVFPRFSVLKGDGYESRALIPYGPFLESVAPEGLAWEWVRARATAVEIGVEKGEEEEERNENDKKTTRRRRRRRGFVVVAHEEEGESTGDNDIDKRRTIIPYDYLILATGSTSPTGLPSRLGTESKTASVRAFRNLQDRIETASNVVVLGGGPAGVELAADTKDYYPQKNVTLVHSRNSLLNRFGPKMQKVAMKELERLGVRVILGERAQQEEEEEQQAADNSLDRDGYVVLSKSGEKIACDCLIKCIGQTPNSTLLGKISPSSVTPSGHIKVRPTLQIAVDVDADADPELYDNIYAIGDVTDTGAKNARSAVEQAEIAAENIGRAIKGKKQMEYRSKWWEGITKITLGLTRSVAWISDGKAEITLSSTSRDVTMGTERLWRMFGVKPFDDGDADNSNIDRTQQGQGFVATV